MKLIGGTEACRILGISHKSGTQAEILKKNGIDVLFMQRQGRGNTCLVDEAQVLRVASERDAKRAAKLSRAEAVIEPTKWVPTKVGIEILLRLEARLISMENEIHELKAMWETKKPNGSGNEIGLGGFERVGSVGSTRFTQEKA